MLEQFNNQYDAADYLIEKLNVTADHIRLVIPPSGSMWWNKANLFTLIVEIMNKSGDLKAVELARENLANFAKEVPKDYQLAAREAVNNKAERLLRAEYVAELI